MILAVGFEVGGQESGKFGGLAGLTGIGELFDEQEEEVGLVVKLFGEVEPKGFGFGEFALGEEVLE